MATDLCTLSQFKTYKTIHPDNTDEDALISQLISSVSNYVKDYCGRTFVDYYSTPKVEYFDGMNCKRVFTDEFPVISVESVEVSSDGGSTYEEFTDYITDKSNDSIVSLGSNFITTSIPTNSLKITYTAGYDPNNIPPDLRQACMDLVEYFRSKEYTPRKDWNDASIENVSFREGGGSKLPPHIARVLSHYRMVY